MCFYDGMRHVFSHCCKQTKSLTELEVQVTLVLRATVCPIQEHWKTLKKSVYLVYTSTYMYGASRHTRFIHVQGPRYGAYIHTYYYCIYY